MCSSPIASLTVISERSSSESVTWLISSRYSRSVSKCLLLFQQACQLPVRALDRPVLIADPAVVARCDYTQAAAELALAASEIACIAAIAVAKSAAEAVGAVFSFS